MAQESPVLVVRVDLDTEHDLVRGPLEIEPEPRAVTAMAIDRLKDLVEDSGEPHHGTVDVGIPIGCVASNIVRDDVTVIVAHTELCDRQSQAKYAVMKRMIL